MPNKEIHVYPKEIQNIILDYMDDEIGDTSGYTPADNMCSLFENRLPVIALLQHAAKGEEEQAEKMVAKDPSLLYIKDRVKDYSRSFKNISTFQYSGWAYDIDMLIMLIHYIPSALYPRALSQLDELEMKKTEHGEHFNFTPAVTAINDYVNKYKHLDKDKRISHWCTVWGGEQKLFPASVAQDYCIPGTRTYSPGYPPKFNQPKEIRALSCINDGGSVAWFPLSGNAGLGTNYAFTIDRCNPVGVGHCNMLPVGIKLPGRLDNGFGGAYDVIFLTALSAVRPRQFNRLKQHLRDPEQVSLASIYESPKAGDDNVLNLFMSGGRSQRSLNVFPGLLLPFFSELADTPSEAPVATAASIEHNRDTSSNYHKK